jgi:hypothetical protein
MINELIEIVYAFFSTKLGVVILGVCTIIGVIGGHQLYRLLLSLWSKNKLGLSKVYHFFTFSKLWRLLGVFTIIKLGLSKVRPSLWSKIKSGLSKVRQFFTFSKLWRLLGVFTIIKLGLSKVRQFFTFSKLWRLLGVFTIVLLLLALVVDIWAISKTIVDFILGFATLVGGVAAIDYFWVNYKNAILKVVCSLKKRPQPPNKITISPVINARVFVNAAPEDYELAQQIISLLGEKGVKNIIPPVNFSKEGSLREDVESNLRFCDAIIILYDKANKTWVDRQVEYCNRIIVERVDQPIKVGAICTNKPSSVNIKDLRNVEQTLMLDYSTVDDQICLERFISGLEHFIAVLVEKVG